MSGKARPSLRKKVLYNVRRSDLPETNKKCIEEVFRRMDEPHVSMAVLEQVMWERDVAMQQLEEHGIPFCAKADDVVKVLRCKDCKHMIPQSHTRYCTVWHGANGMGDDGFCNYGERRDDT